MSLLRLLTPQRLVVASFAVVIAAGAVVLLVSASVRQGLTPHSAVDALFMATSAVCVTGLVVRDLGSEYTALGQLTILVLIQMGGLGILTFSNLLLLFHGGRVGLRERMILEQTHGTLPQVPPALLLRRIILYTAAIEGAGVLLLTPRFALDHALPRALWLAVFHSVSAFCNAGFGLFSDSLMKYSADPYTNLVFMVLIILGGLGFIVFADVGRWLARRTLRPRRRVSLHSKMVLATTAVLIVGGTALIWTMELGGEAVDRRWWARALQSLFLSVTVRTAGFNTVDTGRLTNATLMAVILLMIIGGSPGSTAGGIKTTTFATLCALVRSRILGRPQVESFERSIPGDTVAKALTTATGFLVAILTAVILLQITELGGMSPIEVRGRFLEHLFEVVSALGTVGLSTGITAGLSAAGKLVIVVCMFVGRLGPLMVASSVIVGRRRVEYSYPEEQVIIG